MKTFREIFEEEELNEVDSILTRMKKAKAARRNKAKRILGAKKARKKIKIDKKTLDRRSTKAARTKLAKRRLKGASLASLGKGQKIALSKFLDKKTAAIAKLAKKLRKGIRQKELMKKRKKPPITKANKSAIPQK